MTREIKFRIPMFTDKGTFIEFQYLELGDEIYGTLAGYNGEPEQYTGLKDKNGKEIWEGDIVKVGSENWFDKNYTKNEKVTISWTGVKFGDKKPYSEIYQGEVSGQQKNYYDMFEVIGNIYENKELIK